MEALYKQYWSLAVKSRDLQSYWVYLAIITVIIVMQIGKTGAADLPLALLGATVLVHGACVLLPTPGAYSRYRHVIILTLRCLYMAVSAYGNSPWYFSPPATFAAACKVTLAGSGISVSTFSSLGLVTPVKVQLPLQLLSVATFAWLQNGAMCATLQSTPAGVDFIASAWTWGQQASALLTRIIHPVAFPDAPPPASLPLEAKCLNVVAFVQVMVSYLLLTTIVYVLERASRRAFLARHCKRAADRDTASLAASAWLLFRACSVTILTWEVLFTVFTVMYKPQVAA